MRGFVVNRGIVRSFCMMGDESVRNSTSGMRIVISIVIRINYVIANS